MGSYADVVDDRTPCPDDASVVVEPGYEIYINGKIINHGSLWTNKCLGKRHRENLTNCVKDSQAWHDKTSDAGLRDVVDQIVQRFGEYDSESKMYKRLHRRSGPHRSVKVFIGGRRCEFCQHCDAYEFLNEILRCQSRHGPKIGWKR